MQRHRWPTTVLALLLALALVAAACGGDDGGSDEASGDTTAGTDGGDDGAASGEDAEVDEWLASLKERFDGTKLTVAMAAHPATDAFQEMTGDFEDATGIDVQYDVMEEGQLGEKTLIECQSKSDRYDGFMSAAEAAAAGIALDCVQPLDDLMADTELTPEFFDQDDIMEAYRDLFVVDGTTVGIPFAGETVFLMYRKDLLEEAGLEVPSTYDELLEAAEELNKDGVAGIVFRARKGWEFTYTWSVFMFPFGGRMLDPETGEATLDVTRNAESLEYMKQLKEFGPPGMESFSFPEAWGAMQTGQAAMAIEASAAAPELENPEKSTVVGKIGYAPLPEGPEGAYSGVWGWGLATNKHSKNQEAMWALTVYLTSKAQHPRFVELGGPPSRKSVFEDEAFRADAPYVEATEQALEQAGDLAEQGLSVVPKTPRWFEISDILGSIGSEVFVGQRDAEDGLAEMQQQVEQLLAG